MIERCVRCGVPSGILMTFSYEDRVVHLGDLTVPTEPGRGYPMCEEHAGRLTPPVGWTLVDKRQPVRPLFASLEVA